jgi:periplasmic protein TonB
MKFIVMLLLFSVPFFSRAQSATDTAVKAAAFQEDKAPRADSIVNRAEVEASVDAQLWRQNLYSVLVPFIEKAASKKMKVGTYVVNVRFLVEKDGSISDVQALNDPGYGLAQGAVKAVKSGPKWTPGFSYGRPVRSYHTQPITFVISEQ